MKGVVKRIRYSAPIGTHIATVQVTETPAGNDYDIEIANLGMKPNEWEHTKATVDSLLDEAGYKTAGKVVE